MIKLFEISDGDDLAGLAILAFAIGGGIYTGLITFGIVIPTGFWAQDIISIAPMSFIAAIVTIPLWVWITYEEKKKKETGK